MPKMLIIEDNKINCMIYEKIFSNKRTIIDFAYDGQQGIEKFEQNTYHVVLLDLDLPKISGIGVVNLIKAYENAHQERAHTPVIIITAANMAETRVQSFKAGADDYLTKPFNISSLKKMVQQYIRTNLKERKLMLAKQAK